MRTRGAKVASADGSQALDAVLRRAVLRLLPRVATHQGARLEAEVLLAHALLTTRAGLLLRHAVSADELRVVDELLARRVDAGEPIAYITGRREFREHVLHVDARVLVPRPETEVLVDVFEALHAAGSLPPGVVVDRGTGSGNIALAVCGTRRVLACDVSAAALDVAARNVRESGSQARVTLVRADGLSWVAARSAAAVLANPPYIEPADHAHLPDDVRRHEPRIALVPGEGSVRGMFSRLLVESAAALRPGGWLITEVGAGQAALVASLASVSGFGWVSVTPDLSGIERVVAARRT